MMATGFPFLTMMLMGLMPVLVGWMVYAGKSPEVVSTVLSQILCGIFGSELICLLWPNTAEKRIAKASAATLRDFSKQIREAFGSDRPLDNQTGKVRWTPSQSLGFNNLLTLARSELGEETKRFKSLAGLVEHVRYLLVWPKVYEVFIRGGHFDKWMIELEPERLKLHDELYKAVEQLAQALEDGTEASDIDDLEKQFEVLDRRTSEWMAENRSELPLENRAVIEARCHYGGVVLDRLKKIICFTRNQSTFEDEDAWDIPRPMLTGILLNWNPNTGLFAFKGLTAVASGFVVASLFPRLGRQPHHPADVRFSGPAHHRWPQRHVRRSHVGVDACGSRLCPRDHPAHARSGGGGGVVVDGGCPASARGDSVADSEDLLHGIVLCDGHSLHPDQQPVSVGESGSGAGSVSSPWAVRH